LAGERYGGGAAALGILASYWLLYGALVVSPGFLVGAGRAPDLARVMTGVALADLALTPELGLEDPAPGTAIPFFVAFPPLLRLGMSIGNVPVGELARRAWAPA